MTYALCKGTRGVVLVHRVTRGGMAKVQRLPICAAGRLESVPCSSLSPLLAVERESGGLVAVTPGGLRLKLRPSGSRKLLCAEESTEPETKGDTMTEATLEATLSALLGEGSPFKGVFRRMDIADDAAALEAVGPAGAFPSSCTTEETGEILRNIAGVVARARGKSNAR